MANSVVSAQLSSSSAELPAAKLVCTRGEKIEGVAWKKRLKQPAISIAPAPALISQAVRFSGIAIRESSPASFATALDSSCRQRLAQRLLVPEESPRFSLAT